jgi:hypothetical protein
MLPLVVSGLWSGYLALDSIDYARELSDQSAGNLRYHPTLSDLYSRSAFVLNTIGLLSAAILLAQLPIVGSVDKLHERILRLEAELEAMRRTPTVSGGQPRSPEGITTLHPRSD